MKQRKSPSLEGLISRLHVDMWSDGTMADVLTWLMQYICRCHVLVSAYMCSLGLSVSLLSPARVLFLASELCTT